MNCNRTTTLVSEGTIAVSTSGAFSIANNVSYGTRNLVLGLVGDQSRRGREPRGGRGIRSLASRAWAQSGRAGAVAGRQYRDGRSSAGDARAQCTGRGEYLRQLSTLDASKVEAARAGDARRSTAMAREGDTATIRAGEFIWTGSARGAGGGDGRHTRRRHARHLRRSALYSAMARKFCGRAALAVDNRLALGFANVSIAASELVTSNGKSTLSVYQTQGVYTPGAGYQYTGGDLAITTQRCSPESPARSTASRAGGDISVMGRAGWRCRRSMPWCSDRFDGLQYQGRYQVSSCHPAGSVSDGNGRNRARRWIHASTCRGRAGRSCLTSPSIAGAATRVLTSTARECSPGRRERSSTCRRSRTAAVTDGRDGASTLARVMSISPARSAAATGHYDAGGTLVPFDAAELTVRAADTRLRFSPGLNQRLNARAACSAHADSRSSRAIW